MTVWTCGDCGAKMRLSETHQPRFCCSCGGHRLASPESTARLETYRKYDEELEEITGRLNDLQEQAKPLHERYTYIMQYFRQQKKRRLISEDEYNKRARKYAFLAKRKDGGNA